MPTWNKESKPEKVSTTGRGFFDTLNWNEAEQETEKPQQPPVPEANALTPPSERKVVETIDDFDLLGLSSSTASPDEKIDVKSTPMPGSNLDLLSNATSFDTFNSNSNVAHHLIGGTAGTQDLMGGMMGGSSTNAATDSFDPFATFQQTPGTQNAATKKPEPPVASDFLSFDPFGTSLPPATTASDGNGQPAFQNHGFDPLGHAKGTNGFVNGGIPQQTYPAATSNAGAQQKTDPFAGTAISLVISLSM